MFSGLPHSSNSLVVKGIVGSIIVVTTSTKGTSATTPFHRSGRKYSDSSHQQSSCTTTHCIKVFLRSDISHLLNALRNIDKICKRFFFFIIFPSSYQLLPISCPPRTCAMANTNPLSTRLKRLELNDGIHAVTVSTISIQKQWSVPSFANPFLYTMETGTLAPSFASKKSFCYILFCIVSTNHFLLFHQLLILTIHIVIESGVWSSK